jgi:hypothetical protein
MSNLNKDHEVEMNNENGHDLFLNPSPCFNLLLVIIKSNKLVAMAQTFLDFKASICFIDKGLVQQDKLVLVKKEILVLVNVIDGWSLFSSLSTHEIKTFEVIVGFHISKFIFDVISSLKRPIIIRLSWFALHNPKVD